MMNEVLFFSGLLVILLSGIIGGTMEMQKVTCPMKYWAVGAAGGGLGVLLMTLTKVGE